MAKLFTMSRTDLVDQASNCSRALKTINEEPARAKIQAGLDAIDAVAKVRGMGGVEQLINPKPASKMFDATALEFQVEEFARALDRLFDSAKSGLDPLVSELQRLEKSGLLSRSEWIAGGGLESSKSGLNPLVNEFELLEEDGVFSKSKWICDRGYCWNDLVLPEEPQEILDLTEPKSLHDAEPLLKEFAELHMSIIQKAIQMRDKKSFEEDVPLGDLFVTNVPEALALEISEDLRFGPDMMLRGTELESTFQKFISEKGFEAYVVGSRAGIYKRGAIDCETVARQDVEPENRVQRQATVEIAKPSNDTNLISPLMMSKDDWSTTNLDELRKMEKGDLVGLAKENRRALASTLGAIKKKGLHGPLVRKKLALEGGLMAINKIARERGINVVGITRAQSVRSKSSGVEM